MSIPEPSSTNTRNGTTTTVLSHSNLNQIPASARSSVEKFVRAPPSEAPYYASARMQERSTHLMGLSSQLNALDNILRAGN